MTEFALPSRNRGLSGKLADALLLRGDEAWARRLAEGDRQVLFTHVARARQKLESARLLWAHEQYVEGLRLAEESVKESLRAAEFARSVLATDLGRGDSGAMLATGAPLWADVLQALGATADDIQDATIAIGGPLGQGPSWNGDLRPEHRRFFRSATRVADTALELLSPLVTEPAKIVTARWVRLFGIVAVLGAFAAAALAVKKKVEVRASASYDEVKFDASKVMDKDPKTEWLLPSNVQGWIEMSFQPRTVKAVKVLNASNPPHNDRATQDFKVELYRDKKLLSSTKHKFEKLVPNPEWMSLPVPEQKVDAVRIVIESHHKSGGGIAELAVE